MTVVSQQAASGGVLARTSLPALGAVWLWAVAAPAHAATVAAPTFSPASGSYAAPQTVTISTQTAGARIYYTTNGTSPTARSTPYGGPIAIAATTTLKAIAVATGYTNSAVRTAAYTLTPRAATPTFSPSPGTFTAPQVVTIADATAGARVYYTRDGTTPTAASTPYAGPIAVSTTTTLKAVATASGYGASAVGEATYTIAPPAAAPSLGPLPGSYPGPQRITLSASVPDAELHFTLDDTPPTLASSTYVTSIPIAAAATIRAIAIAPGFSESAEARGAYSIAATPPDGIAAELTATWVTTAATQTVQFGTTSADVLLLAFVSSGGPPGAVQAVTLTSADVTWTPLAASDGEPGFAGIWWATAPVPLALASTQVTQAIPGAAQAITIVALVGARLAPGAVEIASGASGAPSVALPSSAAGAWYYAVGADPAGALARMMPPGQTLVAERSDAGTSTDLWVQLAAAAPATDGGAVTLAVAGPSSDPWNLAAVEVLPAALPPPAFSPVPGTYDRPVMVSLSARPGARVRYATDGTTATASWTEYAGPIAVASTTTVAALATDGYSTSDVAVATYRIVPVPASIAVQAPSTRLLAGDSQQCVATATFTDGSVREVTNEVTWSSSAPGVASVSATGRVTAARPGVATILAAGGSVAGSLGFEVQGPATTYCYDGAGNMTARLVCPSGVPCDGRCP